jgi:hypothetical protein
VGTVSVPSGASPLILAEGAGSLWATSGGCDCLHLGKPMVLKIDPRTRAVAASLTMPVAVEQIAVGRDAVWVVSTGATVLFRIGPI